MASAKMQKPTNEEHKFSQKISEMTAWGSRVFGHKQQEHQAASKHCTTCQCPASKDTRPACVDPLKKENVNTSAIKDIKSDVGQETKKKDKGEQAKDFKLFSGAEGKKKEKKEHKISTTNASTALAKKDHKNEAENHCFSSMADHWKEKIMMMKKGKEEKYKYSSSSSDSDSENESCVTKKKDNRHAKESKTISK